MRVAIASRIFEPEPSAASFRLAVLATEFAQAGHDVTVLTARVPKWLRADAQESERSWSFRVRRFPVLRDRAGYVRGYIQYLSFDVPLFFRILFSRRFDAVIVEPPPTTAFSVRCATALRRMPFAYYAADVWSDATVSTGAPRMVVRGVRWLERIGVEGSAVTFAVNAGVARRVHELAPKAVVDVIGNGVDTEVFRVAGEARGSGRFLVYTGTASEWQGAEVFVHAMVDLSREYPDLRLVFVGQGSAWPMLKRLTAKLGVPVDFIDSVPQAEAARWLRGATASLASIQPEADYDFAFPTKIYASWSAGTPVVFAGPGPAREVLNDNPFLGQGVEHDVGAVQRAARILIENPVDATQREHIGEWAKERASLSAVARRAIQSLTRRLGPGVH